MILVVTIASWVWALGPNDVVERCQRKFSASVDEGVY